ncbi:MAG: hypothetical protein EPGJADBJ_00266 [Saprospiraceae bacterium]|nr:hypothetical protein [Saprospiraceae bacterium]
MYIENFLNNNPIVEKSNFFHKNWNNFSEEEQNIINRYLHSPDNKSNRDSVIKIIIKKPKVYKNIINEYSDLKGFINSGISSFGGDVIIHAKKSAGRDIVINNNFNLRWVFLFLGLATLFSSIYYFRIEFIERFNLFEKFEESNSQYFNIALVPFKSDINITSGTANNFMSQLEVRLNTYNEKSDNFLHIKYYKYKDGVSSQPDAKKFGEIVHADLVIWGAYTMTPDSTNIRLCYTLLREIGLEENIKNKESKMQVSTLNAMNELREGDLPNDIEFIINWVLGMNYYIRGDYELALSYINDISNNSKNKLKMQDEMLVGAFYKDLGMYQPALDHLHRSLELCQKDLIPIDTFFVDLYRSIGYCYSMLENFEMSRKYYSKAEEIVEILNLKSQEVALLYNDIGITYKDMSFENGSFYVDSSICYYFKSIKMWQNLSDTNNYSYMLVLNNMAVSLDLKNQIPDAEEFHLKSIAKIENHMPSEHPILATLYNNIAKHYLQAGDTITSENYLIKSINIMEKKLDPESVFLAGAYNNIAKVYFYRGKYSNALNYAHKSLKIIESNNFNNINAYKVYKLLSDIYMVLNRKSEHEYYANQFQKLSGD